MGCVRDAKANTAVTYWPAAIRAGARLHTRARVCEVTVDRHGRATGATYIDAGGQRRHQSADAVLICANGIGTPRLLLLSAHSGQPGGLANSSGTVGKRLMFHPIAFAIGVFDVALQGHKGITACSILSQEFYETDPDRGFLRGYEMQVTRSHGPLMTALGGFGLDIPWGARHHDRFFQLFDRTVGIAVTSEDLPDEANTVTLHPSLVDSDGIPAPSLHYRVDDNASKILQHGLARSREVLMEAGASEVLIAPLMTAAGFHLMGTARMGEDPSRSVVDPYGRTHDVKNLFVADGSVFVTAAAVNPTPTLQALALRTADHIVQTDAGG